jgi:branched-chain amino acid transport system substrate-binding protein
MSSELSVLQAMKLCSRRHVLVGGMALLSAAALLGTGFSANAADGEISIGYVGPVTGPFAELGTAMRDGALVAVEAVNKAGGVRIGGRSYTV